MHLRSSTHLFAPTVAFFFLIYVESDYDKLTNLKVIEVKLMGYGKNRQHKAQMTEQPF